MKPGDWIQTTGRETNNGEKKITDDKEEISKNEGNTRGGRMEYRGGAGAGEQWRGGAWGN